MAVDEPLGEGGASDLPHHDKPDSPIQTGLPWVRYRLEYRSLTKDELIDQRDTRDPNDAAWNTDEIDAEDWPVFDVVKTIKTQDHSGEASAEKSTDGDAKPRVLLAATLAPTYAIRIYSPAIINAIQSVVKYYPSQDLTGDSILIPWPYAILVHHYDELKDFVSSVTSLERKDRCSRERDVEIHLGLLFDYLESSVMQDVRIERERNKRNRYTFEWFWVAFRPGQPVVWEMVGDPEPITGIIHSLQGGVFENPPCQWTTKFWSMDYNGICMGRTLKHTTVRKFDGERRLDVGARRLVFFPEEDGSKTLDETTLDDSIKSLIREGELYWNLLTKQCRWQSGKTTEFPFTQIDSHVMVDLKAYLAERPYNKPEHVGEADLRRWVSDCTCNICRIRRETVATDWVPMFGRFNLVELAYTKKIHLTWKLLFLCPKTVPVFVFRTRTWVKVHVRDLVEPKFDSQMINNLVMDPIQLKRLKALATSYVRTDKHGNKLPEAAWSADFVKGKGQGLIFLLHGRPGVGKTCTAESIAEYIQKPLMVLTCTDIGTEPKDIENNLTRDFTKAKNWGAVLLIDEADIFMEERSSKDLTRNSLVAGFLRALEFYDGILFLTTNRVGTFDDAFISRIHVQLYYPGFSEKQRREIWQTFADKLKKDCGSYMRLDSNAKEYLKSDVLQAIDWNGREIRNAFQTAVSLAEHDAEKDEDGKVLVTDDHFRAVVELSSDFKKYLATLHKKNEAQRAAFKHDRYDDYARNDYD